MPWLNWSLKLHFRLRTISLLIFIHITHVYFQWIPYSFVWLYLIKCVSHAQFLLIKHKNIFECFSCFWKLFCFYKKCENFQKQCCPILATWSQVSPVARSYSRFLQLTGRSLSQSRKTLRKIFILGFSRLVRGWKLQLRRLQKNFRNSLRNFLVGGTFNREKHLDKFFKNFISSVSRLVLATCTWLGSVVKITCFAL